MSKYYAGIDGGGSKTLAVIVDENGQAIGRGVAGSSNNQVVGVAVAAYNIGEAVRIAAESGGIYLPLERIVVGLAGVDRVADHTLMLNAIEKLNIVVPINILLDNDAKLILYALPKAVGVGLIAGTGSIALGCNSGGKTARAGGWGYVCGDEGSGYDLGRKALQAAVRYADKRGPKTRLLKMILQEWQLNEASEIIGKVYQSGAPSNQSIASLARLVFEAEAQGDTTAQKLVAQAAQELALAVKVTAVEVGLGQTEEAGLPLALAGGLLVNFDSLRQKVIEQLETHFKLSLAQVEVVNEPGVVAAQAACDDNFFNI